MRAQVLCVLLLLCTATTTQANWAGEIKLDKSKGFAYTLPERATVVSVGKNQHDLIALASDDGRNRSIVITDQPGTSTFPKLQKIYERDLAKALKDFELISSELVELRNKRKAIKIVHTNTMPGIPIRQINYILEVGAKRYFVACTVMKSDGDKYDQAFEAFVTSIAEPEAPKEGRDAGITQ